MDASWHRKRYTDLLSEVRQRVNVGIRHGGDVMLILWGGSERTYGGQCIVSAGRAPFSSENPQKDQKVPRMGIPRPFSGSSHLYSGSLGVIGPQKGGFPPSGGAGTAPIVQLQSPTLKKLLLQRKRKKGVKWGKVGKKWVKSGRKAGGKWGENGGWGKVGGVEKVGNGGGIGA